MPETLVDYRADMDNYIALSLVLFDSFLTFGYYAKVELMETIFKVTVAF